MSDELVDMSMTNKERERLTAIVASASRGDGVHSADQVVGALGLLILDELERIKWEIYDGRD